MLQNDSLTIAMFFFLRLSVLLSLCLCTDVEVDVDELNQEQVLDVNKMATSYGMAEGDFVR